MQLEYLNSVKKQFAYYKSLGEKTFDQVDDSDLFWHPKEGSNSIAIVVNHLWGNMLSRWTDFLVADGEKTWRDRDLEFEPVIQSRHELTTKWNAGWECLFEALNSINEDNFNTKG